MPMTTLFAGEFAASTDMLAPVRDAVRAAALAAVGPDNETEEEEA